MAFVSRRELEGTSIGSRIRLLQDVSVLKGMFKRGSVLIVEGDPDPRGEFLCRDLDSGETVYITPALCHYEKA